MGNIVYTIPNPFQPDERKVAGIEERGLVSWFSTRHFHYNFKGRQFSIAISDIGHIQVKKHFYMAFLLIGGIIGGFSLIGYGTDYLHPYFLLAGVLLGSLLVFLGYQGFYLLEIGQGKEVQRWSLPNQPSGKMNFYFDFLKRYLSREQEPIMFYRFAKVEKLPIALQKLYFLEEEGVRYELLIPDFQLKEFRIAPQNASEMVSLTGLPSAIFIREVNADGLVLCYLPV